MYCLVYRGRHQIKTCRLWVLNTMQLLLLNLIKDIIWAADIPGSDEKYLAFFNQWESLEPADIKVSWKQLGLSGDSCHVRDLWAKKDMGTFKERVNAPINAHGTGLYKISK